MLIAIAASWALMDMSTKAVKIYAKAVPDTTFVQLEKAFRNKHFNVYVIGVVSRQPTVSSPTLFRALTRHQEADESKPHTIISLQGKMNCKYQVRFSLTAYPKRKATAEGWPPSPEDNLKRLEDAGFVEDRGVSKCSNCNGEAEPQPRPSPQMPRPRTDFGPRAEMGHIAKMCKEDKREVEHTRVLCVNCGEEGHRARDCAKERVDPNVCRNCKSVAIRVIGRPGPTVLTRARQENWAPGRRLRGAAFGRGRRVQALQRE